MNGGTLKSFTVPPAPIGTLDATLAASEIPVFALGLRQAPAWFKEPRASRQIGAFYPEDNPYAFLGNIVAPEAFDAILFIETTTAARKNPGH
jgi:erythromycin esterase